MSNSDRSITVKMSESNRTISVKLEIGMYLRNKLTGKLGIIHSFNNLFLYLENHSNGNLWKVRYNELNEYNMVALRYRH